MTQYVYFTDGHKEEALECRDINDGGKIVKTISGYYRRFADDTIGKMAFEPDGSVIWNDVSDTVQRYAVDEDFSAYNVDMKIDGFWIRGVLYSREKSLGVAAIMDRVLSRLKGDTGILFDYQISIL